MAQALVPLKDLVLAKTRLAGLLNPAQRRALAQSMVEDVLAVLAAHPDISRTTLVSDDPGAGLLAARYEVEYWPEAALGCRGLNAVITCASERLLAGGESPLLVLHGDLPWLSAADISTVLRAQRSLNGLIIGCDRHGTGTNLLAFDAGSIPRFCFGADSCARHLEYARSVAMAVQVLDRPGIALDVDEAADLKTMMASGKADWQGKTMEFLADNELGARLALALATLPDETAASASETGAGKMDKRSRS